MTKINRLNLRLVTLLGLFLCFFGWESLASASELPPGVIVGDNNGVTADIDGKYFIEHNNIQPGMTFKKAITISNYSQEPEPFYLRLAMKGDGFEGDVNLLEAITVTLTLEGNVIYEGNLSGKASDPTIKLPLYLGKYKVGDTKVLEANFKVSSDLPEESWKKANKADFFWGFYATKEDETIDSSTEPSTEPSTSESTTPPIITPKPPKPKVPFLPQTGEEWSFVIMGMIIGVFVVMVSLIIAKKRRNRLI